MATTNIDDNSYVARLQALRAEEEVLVQKLLNSYKLWDGDAAERLVIVRAEMKPLLDKLIQDNEFLGQTARIDTLTGVYNRSILPSIREYGAVVMCDIDDFKDVNTRFDHSGGDLALRALGQSILKNIRIGDVGVRYGGDEFTIIFNTFNKDVIDSRMRKIAEDANKMITIPGLQITLSVGVAFAEEGEKLETVMQKADRALFVSKDNGKNQITYFEPGMTLQRKG